MNGYHPKVHKWKLTKGLRMKTNQRFMNGNQPKDHEWKPTKGS